MNEFRNRNLAWIVAAVAIVSLMIAAAIFGTKGIFSSNGILGSVGSIEIDEEKTYPSGGIDSIRVFSTSTDVRFTESPKDEIRFHLHGTVRTSNTDRTTKLVERSSGNRLIVGAEPPKGVVRIQSSNLTLDVYVPKDFSGDLKIDSVSGDIELPFGFYAELEMKTTSGDITANGVESKSLSAETTSGDIEIPAGLK